MPHPYKPLPDDDTFGSGLLLDVAIVLLASVLMVMFCASPS